MTMMLMWIVRIDNGEYQTYRRRPFHSRLLDQPRLKAGAKVLIYPTIETPGKSGNPREKIVKEISYQFIYDSNAAQSLGIRNTQMHPTNKCYINRVLKKNWLS